MEPLKNEKYDCMDSIIESIYNDCVKLDRNESGEIVNRINYVIQTLLRIMKNKDSNFASSFNKIGYTGSFYDRLKVGKADEFDLNLILNHKLTLDLCKTGCLPGFVSLKVLDPYTKNNWYLNNWVTNGFLSPAKIKRWLEGLVTRSLNELGGKIHGWTVQLVKSGPALTLNFFTETHPIKNISIDLVPVFAFKSSQWPFVNRKPKKFLNSAFEEPWFAVPKGEAKLENCWRISFPIQERAVMGRAQFLKYILRLLKKVRDELNMKGICSYHIKTMFLLELEVNDRVIWSQHRRGRLFMMMLYRFREYLHLERIPFFWDKGCNLIGNLPKSYLANCYGKLNNFIKKIDEYVSTNNSSALELYIRGKLFLPVVYQSQSSSRRRLQDENRAQDTSSCLLQ